jgi:hypothetical protein
MQRLIKIALPALIFAGAVLASASSAQTASAPRESVLEVAFTYTGTGSNLIDSSRFWIQGGAVQLHGQFYGGWGVVADVSGAHIANINSSGVGLDLITATFGPRCTWKPAHGRYSIYGQGLVGEAWGTNSVFPGPSGAETATNNMAVKAGGGVNIELARHFALRAVEADYLRTQLPNSTSNVQNNLQLGVGIVLRLH